MCLVSLLVVLGLAVIVALVLLFRILAPSTRDGEGPSSGFRRPSSDYTLDPNWDYFSAPKTREYNWVVQDIVANPDGVFRPMLVVNGKFPGEMIRCNEGDTIVVNVENQSVNATTVHWHGIFQNGTNWMDGVPGVTQCPIAPGKKFQYKFKITFQSGTYFYHGHQAAQGIDGLVGPIVVHSRKEKQDGLVAYDSDRVVMLQDWYYDPSSLLLMEKLSPGSETSPIPNSALINGANKVDCALHTNRRCDSSSAALPILDLEQGKNHRLRILNVGAFAWFEVTADRHFDMPVMEIDGTEVAPTPEDGILVGPGQRYSIVLSATAPNHTVGDTFWFRARMVKHCFSENVLPEQGFDEARAVIRYTNVAGASAKGEAAVPTTENDSNRYAVECRDPKPGRYFPAVETPAPAYAHHSWYLRVNLEIGNWRLERGFLNQSTFRTKVQSPTLHRVVEGLAAQNESFAAEGVNTRAFDPVHELVISSKDVEVVDVILQSFDEGNHPFHLHGQQFWVLAAGHGYFPGYEALGFAPDGKGLLNPQNNTMVANPLRRDVATVEGYGWHLIRFVADNPGIWLFHCHMIWHGESGMAMQFLSRLDELEKWSIPADNARLCEADLSELEKGSVPKDEIFFGKPAGGRR
ncbi:hypothetical protein GQ53DRAFT_752517 [Thozetella sp. PMI_491]|nr:hypothetical protein GQ53DRAFT_752517 [Thozetella sp. PMI_491]